MRRAVRRTVLLLSACGAAATVDKTAGLRWQAADELARLHPRATDATPHARLRRELERSIHSCVRPRQNHNETEKLLKDMIFSKEHTPLVTLHGRIFAPPDFVKVNSKGLALPSPQKVHGLIVMLASAQRVRKKPLPNAVFWHNAGSSGNGKVLTGGKVEYLDTVIAKKTGYGEFCGILIPNPYYTHQPANLGETGLWRYFVEEIHEAAKARPVDQREAKVFWRGKCANYEWTRTRQGHSANDPRALQGVSKGDVGDGACAGSFESGNRARLLAVSLTVKHPEHFDVKCSKLDPPRNFTCIEDAAYAAQLRQARDDVLENSHLAEDISWTDGTDYTKYKYLLNLPGKTEGSYSRNLNHLWSTGGVVLLWDEPIVEWYYPLLETGVTHLVVNRSTAEAVVERLEADPAEYARLAAGAEWVDKKVMSAEPMAEYFFHVLEAIRRHVRYDLVLDDRRALLELLESWTRRGQGACERLVEWKVSSRMLKLKHPNSPAREAWDVVTKGKNVCETLLGMKSDTPFYQF